jgi:hypothetical protein
MIGARFLRPGSGSRRRRWRVGSETVAGGGTKRWSGPTLECDVVMKGGITSGVVYPSAVVRIAERYTFRQVGGTSAGAIAAAAVAAAEHGRPNGFVELDELPGKLAGTKDDKPFILTLFQPEPETKPLFRSALAFLQHGPLRGAAATVLAFWRFPLLAVALAGLAIGLAAAGLADWVVAVAVLAVTPWILVVGVLRDVLAAVGNLADNDFGLCRLGTEKPQALTPWLHDLIQRTAGRADGPVLTFADLWGAPPLPDNPTDADRAARQKEIDRLARNARDRKVDLQVITTNLTVGRPIRLPTQLDPHSHTYDEGGFMFDEDEWRTFFPPGVVDYLVENAPPMEPKNQPVLDGQAPGRKLRYLPPGGNLPVIVGARMSLSFPVLISTVPLWQIEYRRDREPALRRMVFSDGGISSNFPIQLFDAPLPQRPTFAIDLAGFERDEEQHLDDPSACVVVPPEPTERAFEAWKPPESMPDFALAIKDAMQNWHDNSLARMQGFRERVVHVKLASGEGGLNLAMDAAKVKHLTDRGEYAGQKLVELFSGAGPDPAPTAHWNHSRFARVRTLLSVTAVFLDAAKRGYVDAPDQVSTGYADLIRAGTAPPYTFEHPGEVQAALDTIEALNAIAVSNAQELDDRNVPHPRATIRISPPL